LSDETRWGKQRVAQFKEYGETFKKFVQKRGVKIITLVRDPVARALSSYMQLLDDEMGMLKSSEDIEVDVQNYVYDLLERNHEFVWFDKEIKELTGVDIYAYPFDKEKGYAWIKKGKIELLVLKMESLNENEEILGEFVGISDLKMEKRNIADNKESKYIYEGMKSQIKIPPNLLEWQYKHNEKMAHFYSEKEREEYLNKWMEM